MTRVDHSYAPKGSAALEVHARKALDGLERAGACDDGLQFGAADRIGATDLAEAQYRAMYFDGRSVLALSALTESRAAGGCCAAAAAGRARNTGTTTRRRITVTSG